MLLALKGTIYWISLNAIASPKMNQNYLIMPIALMSQSENDGGADLLSAV